MDFLIIYSIREEMVKFLNQIGIPVLRIDYDGRNDFSIFIKKINEIKSSKELIDLNGDLIISKLHQLLIENNCESTITQYEWKSEFFNHVYSIDSQELDSLIRNCKDEVLKEISIQISEEYRPEYVFSHSSSNDRLDNTAGYYVVFPSRINYQDLEETKKRIDTIIWEILKKSDKSNIISDMTFKIEYTNSNDKNLYFISRED